MTAAIRRPPVPGGARDVAEVSISWLDRRLRGGWLGIVLAAAVALSFLPTSIVNGDEYFYAGQALTLARGRIVPADGDGLPVPQLPAAAAFKYPIGWPMLLAPARLVSFRAMFVVTLLAHLAGGAAVARILVRRGLPSWLNAVYLFHPVAWLYSRTLMSDAPATAALLVAIDAWENRDRIACAIALGLAPAMRLANLIALAGFGAAVLPEAKRRWRDVAAAGVSVAAFVGLQVAVTHHLAGGFFSTPYAASIGRLLDGAMAIDNALLYSAGLLFLPPFSLFWAIARRGTVDRWAAAAVPVLVFFVAYAFHDAAANPLHTLVGGQRLVLPAHAALLVATCRAWAAWRPFRMRSFVLAAGVAAGVVGCLAMRTLEQRYAPAVEVLRECKARRIAYNTNAHRVALSLDADEYRLVDGRDPARLGDLVILGKRFETNRPQSAEPEQQLTRYSFPGARCRELGNYVVWDLGGRCPEFGRPCAIR